MGWVGTKVIYIRVITGQYYQTGLDIVGIATAFVLVFGIISNLAGLRLNSAYTFFVARGAKRQPLMGAYILFLLATTLVMSVAGAAIIIWSNWFPGYEEAILLLVIAVPLLHVPSGAYTTLHIAEGRAALGQVPAVVESVVRMAFIVYFAFQYSPPSATNLLYLDTLVTKIAIAYVLGSLAGALVSLSAFLDVSIKGFLQSLKDMFSFAYPLMGSMLITFTIPIITPILILALTGNAALLLVFTSINAFYLLLLFIPNAIVVPLFPKLARLHAEGRMEDLRKKVYKAVRYSIMLLAPGIIAVAVFRVDILNIFYTSALVKAGAALPLALLVFVSLPMTLFQITGTALDSVGLQRREFYVSGVQLAVLLVGLVVFVPPFQVMGAVYAVLVGALAGLGMNAIFLARNLPVSIPWKSMATVLIASAATFLAFSETLTRFIGFQLTPSSSHYVFAAELFGYVLIGLLIYGIVLIAIGELTKDDVIELSTSIGLSEPLAKKLSRVCWKQTSSNAT